MGRLFTGLPKASSWVGSTVTSYRLFWAATAGLRSLTFTKHVAFNEGGKPINNIKVSNTLEDLHFVRLVLFSSAR